MLRLTYRPRSTFGRVIEELGSVLFEVIDGQVDLAQEIGGVAIYDAHGPPTSPDAALVLGIGLHQPEQITTAVKELAAQDAVGLVVRSPNMVTPPMRRAAQSTGVVLLGLRPDASWAQAWSMLRSLLGTDDLAREDGETLGGADAGDLFALAGAVAALLDAPVTIEDLNLRILAFSGNQDKADDSRRETLLGRQVPERYIRELGRRGVFKELYGSDEPVFVEGVDPTDLPRVAIRVRAGDEILASMWAAVHEPLSAERQQAFVDSARLVALHLLRRRAGADVERRLRTELVATVLEGGRAAAGAATRLGIANGASCVLALGLPVEDDAVAEAELQRLSGALTLHLTAVHAQAAVALMGRVVYAVVPALGPAGEADERIASLAQDFLTRMGSQHRPVIGIGRIATDPLELPRSRADAERALRVLRSGRNISLRVARAQAVHTAALLLELGDLIAAERQPPTGPLALLAEYDRRQNASLVETLRVWLDSFGDIPAAAETLHIHPNTLRYRLGRLSEIGQLDLTDPEARFAAMLELRTSMPGGEYW